ncbi:MAG: hypothetical protein K9M11_04285 [Candidatus Pacebacteria bacterium]|nr:hypothetical protein [Candidatus Paceibacterota bacterium]
MFSWAHQRQLMYGAGVLLFLILIVGIPVYFVFFNALPTCFDGKMNGREVEVDCGGSCERACSRDVLPEPIVTWSRSFNVARGLNNLVAYVQNPNVNYTAEPIPYIFLVYDKENVLLGTREGYARVPPAKTFPIFEPAFDAGTREPAKAVFEFTAPAVWNKFEASKPELDVIDERVLFATTTPTIKATLLNKTINKYTNIEVVAIIYNKEGNAFAASKTVVDIIRGNDESPLVFTWPTGFTDEVSKVEIIPKLPI